MKVLQVSSEQSWRGGEQQIAYLIEELQKLGVESHAAVRRNSEFEDWCIQKKVPMVRLPFKNEMDLVTAFGIKSYCRKQKFDLAHLHSSRSHGLAVLASAFGSKTPLILSRRVDFKLKSNAFSKWKYNHPSIKRIVCVSKAIEEIVRSSVKHPERCLTVYDGVDLERFAGKGSRGVLRNEFGIGLDEKLVGNIAAIAPHKDYFTFLDAARILLEKERVKFLITGDGPLKEEIKKRITDLELSNHVFLTGFRSDLENVFADLDVLMYTSKEEGLGSTLLDAMAYGLPIVTTEAGGIPEIVKNEINGLTAPVRNPNILAQQVLRLLHDGNLRKKLIEQGKNFVKDFSKMRMAEHTLQVYRSVLSR